MTEQTPPTRSRPRIPMALATVVLGVGLATVAIYGMRGLQGNASGDPVCRPAVNLAQKLKPLAQGEVAALTMASEPLRVPDLTFDDASGKSRKLSEFRGRTLLVNLWATWCVPCRKEMPALDQLQAKLGGPKFEVVAINIDTRDPEKPKDFLKDGGLTNLSYFHDNSAKVFQDLKAAGRALGMPTSMLVDGSGCEIATIAGPAEWASDDAVKLVKAATEQ
ncbi:thiol:disulfide interchange protein TlpA [Afipia felis]|uniref:Cytochrome c biogenesis protein tlpA n=2 Tax=Afipia felis TaxID=1035 RepID=A0A380W697_AFIFE|nr:TlpA disulfide reductase family protein [Afipia felis]EKS30845.1 Thiol:disulfide interchange protein tlpA [Afipia felis ATCC 53690]SUU75590.1 Cytochrome c biogenesis protein tlpA [Afipia felis]SUU83657.1 Cytochrome c biogenesis protein tlpA [Afipia felis]